MGQESDGRHLLRCFDSGIPYILYRWIYNYKDLMQQQVLSFDRTTCQRISSNDISRQPTKTSKVQSRLSFQENFT